MYGDKYPSPYCGKTIVLTANGKTASAVCVDKVRFVCPISLCSCLTIHSFPQSALAVPMVVLILLGASLPSTPTWVSVSCKAPGTLQARVNLPRSPIQRQPIPSLSPLLLPLPNLPLPLPPSIHLLPLPNLRHLLPRPRLVQRSRRPPRPRAPLPPPLHLSHIRPLRPARLRPRLPTPTVLASQAVLSPPMVLRISN